MTVEIENKDSHLYMQRAIELAAIAEKEGEVPVGAVIVLDGKIIGEGWNRSIGSHDATAHAEMMAIKEAGKTIENYRLVDATLYVTLEPCPMCAGAIVHSRIKQVIFGATDMKTGASGSVINLFTSATAFHFVECESGVMEEECRAQLQAFFKRRRKEKKEERKLQREAELKKQMMD